MSVSRSLFRIICFAQLFAFALTFFASSLALAYPVILNSSEITPLFGTTRSQLIALRADDQGAKRVALQIDEVEDDAALVLREPFEIRKLRGSLSHPKRNDPFAGRMQSVHRIVLDDRDFSSCTEQCSKRITESAKNVCATPYANVLLKITLAENQKQVFLVDCGIQMNVFAARDVKYDSAKSKISTPIYEYIYQSDKNIFFKEICSSTFRRTKISIHMPYFIQDMRWNCTRRTFKRITTPETDNICLLRKLLQSITFLILYHKLFTVMRGSS